MEITDVTVHVIELPDRRASVHELYQVPTVRRTQYTHRSRPVDRPAQTLLMRVSTDEGVEGLCTVETAYVGPISGVVDLLRVNAVGEDPFHREYIFQKLHLGTRWIYQEPGWFGTFDNCLWDIAGKVAGLPVYSLLGKMRDGVPIYVTAGDGPVELYIEHIEQGKPYSIRAYKPHSYKGGKADIPIMRKLRDHVGPDYDLILDPVCSYTLREAIEVGHVLEELDFVWLEEPFFEQKMHQYQQLCSELTIPVMATERLMHDMDLCAQWLIHGATDRIRANARHGTTQVLKMAHFAELYGTNIEVNGTGGLFGLVHAHLGCCIANNDYYEMSLGFLGRLEEMAAQLGMRNPPTIVDGCLVPPDGPGWGAEWDMDYLSEHSAAVI